MSSALQEKSIHTEVKMCRTSQHLSSSILKFNFAKHMFAMVRDRVFFSKTQKSSFAFVFARPLRTAYHKLRPIRDGGVKEISTKTCVHPKLCIIAVITKGCLFNNLAWHTLIMSTIHHPTVITVGIVLVNHVFNMMFVAHLLQEKSS
jgi:hypothetical protein